MRRPGTRTQPGTKIGAIAVAAGLALAACGSDDDVGRFDESVGEIRSAVIAGDRTAATEAIDALAIEGLAAHEDGDIDDAELDELARLIASTRAQVDALVPAPTTTTTTTTTTTAPPDDDKDDDDKPGKGRDKDKDDDKDDD